VLMWASGKGNVEVAKLLIEAGADPRAQDKVCYAVLSHGTVQTAEVSNAIMLMNSTSPRR
jgi:ankyrin repeat protein